jgi:hypothetical protein
MALKTLFLFLLLVSPGISLAAPQSVPSEADLQSMEIILKLAQNGTIIVHATEPEGSIFVEPLFWNKLTHLQKSALLRHGMVFFQNANSLQKKNIEWVGVFDMTSHDTLGSINLQTKKISVKK